MDIIGRSYMFIYHFWELMDQPFHSHKWSRQNFSLQYEYNIKQAGDENREEYQSWDY